jgi:hypothetical protein
LLNFSFIVFPPSSTAISVPTSIFKGRMIIF